jgi:hypothetical protein
VAASRNTLNRSLDFIFRLAKGHLKANSDEIERMVLKRKYLAEVEINFIIKKVERLTKNYDPIVEPIIEHMPESDLPPPSYHQVIETFNRRVI